MAVTDYTITEANIGEVIGPADGYLVNLSMTTPPVAHEVPGHSPVTQRFTSGYLTLQSERGLRPLINVSPQDNGGAFSWIGSVANMIVNGSLGYAGGLTIVGVPRGSVWSLTLSDAPVVRAPSTPSWNFSGANYKPHNPPAAPKTPQGASTARKAGAILQAARTPA
jgi:hypothetical protein